MVRVYHQSVRFEQSNCGEGALCLPGFRLNSTADAAVLYHFVAEIVLNSKNESCRQISVH